MAKRHISRRKKEKMKKTIATLAFILLVSLGLFFMHRWEERDVAPESRETESNRAGQQETGYLIYNDEKYEKKDVETVLLIGIDKFAEDITNDSYNNQQQCDFLLLMVIDHKAKTCTPVQINRDTMAPVMVLSVTGDQIGTVDKQIALAHTYGSGREDSCENTAFSVSSIFWDQPVDHYISVTMDAVQILNDLVGGVTVLVEDDFSRVDETLIQGQKVTLFGEHALTFVRSRGSMEDSTNLARMERQRQYLGGLREQTVTAIETDAGFAIDSLLRIAPYMVSDCTVNQLSDIANDVVNYEMRPIQPLKGNAVKGEEFMEYYLDDEALFDMIATLFYQPVE